MGGQIIPCPPIPKCGGTCPSPLPKRGPCSAGEVVQLVWQSKVGHFVATYLSEIFNNELC